MDHNKQNIRNPKFWVPSLYLAQGLPFFAVAIVANQMLKSMGMPNSDINRWTALIGFAWVFKPLWSPFLELASSCLLYTSPSPRDRQKSRMPSSA